MPRRSISYEVRFQILRLRDRRLSEREIAETLNLPRSSINAVITKFIQHGSVADRPRVGRPPVIGAGIRLFILRQVNSGAFSTTTQLSQAVFDTYQQRVSKSTIRRLLIHEGYRCYVKQKRPQLEPRHEREARPLQETILTGVLRSGKMLFSLTSASFWSSIPLVATTVGRSQGRVYYGTKSLQQESLVAAPSWSGVA